MLVASKCQMTSYYSLDVPQIFSLALLVQY